MPRMSFEGLFSQQSPQLHYTIPKPLGYQLASDCWTTVLPGLSLQKGLLPSGEPHWPVQCLGHYTRS